jgi:flagellar biosynthesis protein FliR
LEGLPPIELESWLVYLFIWARLMGIVFLFPFFSYRGIPFMLRLWLTLVIAFLIFLSMESRPVFDFRVPLEMILILGKEVLTGLALGYLVTLMFSVFLNAGQMIDLKSGLMLSGVFEPQFGSQVTFMGQFYYLLALVFFMTLNGHHFFLKAIADSFVIIPIEGPFMAREMTEGVIRIFAEMFALAFQMVAPIVVILMVMDIALGLIAKTVPQIHVFVEGLPLKIALSLLLAAILMPMFGIIWESLLDRFAGIYNQFLFGW